MSFTFSRPSLRAAGAAMAFALCIASVCSLAKAVPAGDFTALVDLSAKRLGISRGVALTKWDTRQPVADPPNDPREKEVIAAAVDEAKRRNVPTELAAAFFSDQIEASKLMQFALMAEWRRAGTAPPERRADLKTELRPALDDLRARFIDELAATQTLRDAPACRGDMARTTKAYAQSRRLSTLEAIALDRGLARVCGD